MIPKVAANIKFPPKSTLSYSRSTEHHMLKSSNLINDTFESLHNPGRAHHSHLLAKSSILGSNSGIRNGLLIESSIPTSLALLTCSLLAFAETEMIGTWEIISPVCWSLRISLQAVSPSIMLSRRLESCKRRRKIGGPSASL